MSEEARGATANLARWVAEAPPKVRWRLAQVVSRLVYRRAFARFGAGSVIVQPLRLRGLQRIRIGADCAIYERSWIEAEPDGSLTIGDATYLGHDVHVHAVDDITIGRGCMFADGVLVNSGTHVPQSGMAVAGSGPIRIGDDVFLGQRVTVLGGVTIGDRVTVGAGAVVTHDLPDDVTAVGVPARSLPNSPSRSE